VGSQPISNDQNSFNYSCLEVKKKDDNQREKKKEKVSYFNFFDWRN
jgi:hypothetical protein